jgi:hypothetical protein
VKKTLIVIFVFAMMNAHGQINLKTYTSATDTFYWKRYEHIPPPERIKPGRMAKPAKGQIFYQFLSQMISEFPWLCQDSAGRSMKPGFNKYFYFAEINGDQNKDILYAGPSASGCEMVRIYFNDGNSFQLLFEDYQYLSGWQTKQNQLISLQTGEVECEGEYLYFTRDYTVQWNEEIPVIVKGRHIAWYKYSELPRKYFDKPVPFAAAADTLLLRASAAQLNEPFLSNPETFGNIVAKYRSKVRGELLAMKSDGKGNTWYFAEIWPDTKPSASILYGTEKVPVFIRGWISGLSVAGN